MRWSRVRCCNYAYLKGERFYVEILKNAKDFKNVRLLARKYTFLKLQMFQKLLFERNRSKGRRMKHHWTRNLITAEFVLCAFCTVKDASGSSVASLWSSKIKVTKIFWLIKRTKKFTSNENKSGFLWNNMINLNLSIVHSFSGDHHLDRQKRKGQDVFGKLQTNLVD